jgi:DNA-binding transcriptional LysR family regulator
LQFIIAHYKILEKYNFIKLFIFFTYEPLGEDGMDIRQLRYFLTIVEEGQITSAARKLNIAQPPLSQQLKNMEEELGTKLIIRNGRKLELTEAGKALYKRGTTLIKNFDDAIKEVKDTGKGLHGSLSIGTLASCICYLPKRILQFKSKYPNIYVKIWEGDPTVMMEHLDNGNIELALLRTSVDAPFHEEYYSTYPIERDPFVAVVPRKWEIASQTDIRLQDLVDLPLLLLHRINGKGIYEMILAEFKQHGLSPNITCESPDIHIILSLVEAGVGLSIIPQSALFAYPQNRIKALNIVDSSLETQTSIVWRKDYYLSKIALRFIETFK